MIFVCNNCREVIPELNTPGDDVNKNFMCPKCAKEFKETLNKVRKKILDSFNSFISSN